MTLAATPAPSAAADQCFAWQASDLSDATRYLHTWSAPELQAWAQVVAEPRAQAHSASDPGPAVPVPEALAATLDWARQQLASGCGFVLLRGLPFAQWSVDQCRHATWLLAHAVGVPVTQTAKGDRLVDVQDTSRTESTPRQFKTSQELRLHTDPASDLIGLACVQPAGSGGDSVLTSAIRVHDEMARLRPDLLAELYQGMHWHRFGEGRPQDGVYSAGTPIFARLQDRISCRYVRSPIIAGHREAGTPLTERQLEALDLFDRLASSPELRLVFRLAQGDVVLVNNLTVLHARTQFHDPEPPAPQRRLFRLWLQGLPGFRPVPPELNFFNGGACGMPLTGQTAAYDMQSLWKDPASGGVARLGVAPAGT